MDRGAPHERGHAHCQRHGPPGGLPSPVGDAVVTIVVQGVVFRALPGDGGLGGRKPDIGETTVSLPHT